MTTRCPFCQPELAASLFYEGFGCLGVVDIAPIVPGHSLVLPRRHSVRLHELGDAAYGQLWLAVREVTRIVLAVYDADAVDISLQDGAAAGQTVPHLHVHVIPRQPGDLSTPGSWYDHLMDSAHRQRLSANEIGDTVAFIKQRQQTLGL